MAQAEIVGGGGAEASSGGFASDTLKAWIRQVGPFWAASIAGHLLLLVIAGLVLGTVHIAKKVMDAPEFVADVETVVPDQPPLEHFEVGDTPLEPTELSTETLTMEAAQLEQTAQYNDDSAVFSLAGGGFANATNNLGGLGGFDIKALGDGAAVKGAGGVGSGIGTSNTAGTGGAGGGFGGRGTGKREALAASGGTKQSERAVAAALNWFARHQGGDGGWSLGDFTRQCKDSTCTGAGKIRSDAAATAFAMLPFLAAGQTHQSKGPYQRTIKGGLDWLVKHQANDGSLAAGSQSLMYTHGLASITLCEAYGLTKDKMYGAAAQAAIKFIEEAQNKEDGGWRYTPGQPGDTSVVGWQIMALKSGLMSGLNVEHATLELAKHYLALAATKSKKGGLFGYLPESAPTPTMTAVGLLCSQYMGVKREDDAMAEGEAYIMKLLPTNRTRNSYYWYYATQVMHNLPGPEWDTWNRQMRRTLIETQVKEGCAAGSWDPHKPEP
ncbi:MAG TPA: prenyltransferase/squalene oxidase repeat-containing protein, partial [Pirellulales bacterium]|nr:prenyltransferase/squalene oxidase repeat-containing protein [Pirellulales bacterium]